jgi:hypothetical protein
LSSVFLCPKYQDQQDSVSSSPKAIDKMGNAFICLSTLRLTRNKLLKQEAPKDWQESHLSTTKLWRVLQGT